MTKPSSKSVVELIRENFEELTQTERRLANVLLENYPLSCLGSITATAEMAQVSTPTVLRMVKKIGFKGFPDFQTAVRGELEEKISSPIAKFNRWSESASNEHVLNKFADAVMDNLKQSLMQIDPSMFDEVVDILTDQNRTLHVVGGRITRALSDYFFTHMQVARTNVTSVASNSNTWPHYVLNMKKGDILVAFDVRRYEHNILNLTRLARERGVKVVLFTDQWGSPAAKNAQYVFNLRIEVPSAWDSSVVTLFVLEALIAAVQTKTWEETKVRMAELERLFDETKLFKKFNS
ncbi:MurR/RpiR family transcriptional regulator [Terasakiella pusilla]|jgi:DNA-binding MurR/RpiR family transcriptional regulator|uniref:MurR/RpiR family transcriptional regulator n=1 Tax=Terasakiella pusilla TaxID=64973 RepID=UPI00048D5BE0|nr:MurR/RpiR family transcriptional regulator [Terasakiella pusilla]